jgi:NAD(P)-dependent dehydrogenase (short-subunit alcohol dehydrogenase family)
MHYAASKAGLVALTRSVARAYGRDNVLAYVVAPGFVDTDMVAGVVPLGELAPPHEVASAVVVLASGALRHATGETIHLNGGAW